jgi:hypothetical protein
LFLGLSLSDSVPDHSSRIRTRIDVEVHQSVFAFALKVLIERGLVRGQMIGVDASTLEANAAMRTIVRREDGATDDEYLTKLAKASGMETPTRANLPRVDKRRPKGLQRRLEVPSRSRRAEREDEGRSHALGAQGGARGRLGQRLAARPDGAGGDAG